MADPHTDDGRGVDAQPGTGASHKPGRIDYYHNPQAPAPTSVVPSVVAAVRNEHGDLLMIQRADTGRWALPGGGHELGETIVETVTREVAEETGIAVRVERLVGVYTDPGHVMELRDGQVRQQFSICFTARPVGGNEDTSQETTQVRWMPLDQLDRLDNHPTMRLRIRHALQDRTDPYIG